MTYPIIGLTTKQASNSSGQAETRLNDAYIQAVVDAGGIALLIPNSVTDEALRALSARLDGLLLSGGGDIQPERYGGQAHPSVYSINPQRDRTEFLLLEQAINKELPFLGICRGIQVINVACGGTLYEDIADQHPGALKHDCYPEWPRDHLAHAVDIEPGSKLAQVLGQLHASVNSMHHQAIRRISTDLLTTARAPDGVVEAVELPGHPFGMAVQWHPECLQSYAPMRLLFQAFIDAAIQHQNKQP